MTAVFSDRIRAVLTISLTGWQRAALAMVLGALGARALPPEGLWPLMLVALPALIWLMDGAVARARRSLATAFLLGWCFGFGWFATSVYWIGEAFLVDAATYGWMMPIAIAGLSAYLAFWWGFGLMLAGWRWQPQDPARLVRLAMALSLADWLRGHALTGFPWNAPGYVALDFAPLAQLAALTGLWGLDLLVLILAAAPVLIFDRRRRARLLLAVILALGIGIGLWGQKQLDIADPSPAEFSVRLVQPNIPQSDKWRLENARAIFDRLLALSAAPSEDAAEPKLIIWPESAVPFLMDEEAVALRQVADLLGPGRSLLMGAIRRDPADRALPPDQQRIYNSLLGIGGTGEVLAHYDKWHLVPGGEFLPLERWLTPLGLRRLVSLPGSFTPGQGPVSLRLPGIPTFAPLICYEAIFPGMTPKGAERPAFLLNITNDGWFGQSIGPHQHLAQARLRAIEEGLPLLRAANTGISALIDTHGRLRAQLPLGQPGLLDVSLPQPDPETVYARVGDRIFFGILVFMLITMVAFQVFTGSRKHS